MSIHNDKALVARTDIVKAEVVEELQPLQVKATLQIVVPTPNEAMHMMHESLVGMQQTLVTHTEKLETISNRVINDIDTINSLELLYDIRDKLNKRIHLQAVEVSFMKVTDMAQNISVSKSFLEKNMGVIFTEGTHYTRTTDARLVRWNVEQMHKWMRGEEHAAADKALLSKLLD